MVNQIMRISCHHLSELIVIISDVSRFVFSGKGWKITHSLLKIIFPIGQFCSVSVFHKLLAKFFQIPENFCTINELHLEADCTLPTCLKSLIQVISLFFLIILSLQIRDKALYLLHSNKLIFFFYIWDNCPKGPLWCHSMKEFAVIASFFLSL